MQSIAAANSSQNRANSVLKNAARMLMYFVAILMLFCRITFRRLQEKRLALLIMYKVSVRSECHLVSRS